MKSLITTAILLLGNSALAAGRTQVIHTTTNISVANLRCVTVFNPPYTYTELASFQGGAIYLGNQVELEHRRAISEGCEADVLTKLVERAYKRFGYAKVSLEIKQVHSDSTVRAGKCVADFTETVKVTLDPSVIVESTQVQSREMTDCP